MSSSRTDPDTDRPAPGGEDEQAARIDVLMPQMGISVAEGTIIEWRKRPGDWVEADEPICDVTTDKVDVEIPSPASGRVNRLLAEPGEVVSVGTAIAEIDTAAKPGEAHPEEHEAPVKTAPAQEASEPDRSRFYSPVVRRMAEKHGVDLEQVHGTGVGGRVRKRDVIAFVESGAGRGPQRPLHIESPYRPEPAPAGDGAAVRGSPEELLGPMRREAMSPMRQQIARHMVESGRSAAHCTTIVEADFSRVARRRADLAETMARRGVKLTYLAFVARAAIEAIENHPVLNASVEGEELVYHDDVNLGIAVALEHGLIVPVIRNADDLSITGITRALNDLATRARAKKLRPEEVQNGTFTITNPGVFGSLMGTPIISQPQVAILGVGAIEKRPKVITGPDGEDTIAIRTCAYFSISFDHRIIDGAVADQFLAFVKKAIENFPETVL